MDLGERADQFLFLIPDRDTTLTSVFDGVFTAAGIEVLTTPVRAARPNAYGSAPYAELGYLSSGSATWKRCSTNTSTITTRTVHAARWDRRRRSDPAPPSVPIAGRRVMRGDRLGGLIGGYSQAA
jgi:putative transposase